MTILAALLVGPLFFENAMWKSLSPEVTLKVNIYFNEAQFSQKMLNRYLGIQNR